MKHSFLSRFALALVLCSIALTMAGKRKNTLDADATLRSFAPQMRHLVERATAEAEGNRIYPISLKDNGMLKMGDEIDWRSGFLPGMLWMMYEHTGEAYWRSQAERYTTAMGRVLKHNGSHDLGFIVQNSWGRAYDLTHEERYRAAVIEASNTLLTRFHPEVGLIRSWDFNRDRWSYPVIIDNMMNLEMLFRATQMTGDSTYWRVAVSHADRTLENHFRPNASSYHVVDYDPQTGEVRWRGTFQGFADDSYWARGQAWALYGYTMCYRFTREERYLRKAQDVARLWTGNRDTKDDIPYWDMKLPQVDASTPRDASAAAVAASALIELASYTTSQRKAKAYLQKADRMLTSLCSPAYRAETGTNGGFLLLHSTGHLPGKSEIDAPLIYADYYLVEALMRRGANPNYAL